MLSKLSLTGIPSPPPSIPGTGFRLTDLGLAGDEGITNVDASSIVMEGSTRWNVLAMGDDMLGLRLLVGPVPLALRENENEPCMIRRVNPGLLGSDTDVGEWGEGEVGTISPNSLAGTVEPKSRAGLSVGLPEYDSDRRDEKDVYSGSIDSLNSPIVSLATRVTPIGFSGRSLSSFRQRLLMFFALI